jgi:hypothetical protein
MRIRSRRAGILLDGVLAIAILVVGAYALDRLGITFSMILHGARQFLGV